MRDHENDTLFIQPISAAASRQFTDILRHARRDRGMTQQQVANASGISQSTVSQLERGPYPGMRGLELKRLCDYYGLSVDHMLEIALGRESHPEETMALRRLRELWGAVEGMTEARQTQLAQAVELLVRGVNAA